MVGMETLVGRRLLELLVKAQWDAASDDSS